MELSLTVESTIGPKGDFGSTPGELLKNEVNLTLALNLRRPYRKN